MGNPIGTLDEYANEREEAPPLPPAPPLMGRQKTKGLNKDNLCGTKKEDSGKKKVINLILKGILKSGRRKVKISKISLTGQNSRLKF